MRRETQNVVLVLLGGALLKIALTGTYLRYVKPALQPWLIAAGTVMLVLAAVAIGRDVLAGRRAAIAAERGGPVAEAPHGDEDHGHEDHGHRRLPRSPWLLLLPVFAIFLVAPPALGADSVYRAAGRTEVAQPASGKSAAFAPLPSGDVVPMRISDFVTRSAWDATNSLDGRTVRLTGFVVHEAGGVDVARLVISCCAADAMPVKVRVEGVAGAALRDDEWVRVTGRLVPGSATPQNRYVPTLVTSGIDRMTAPADPYEY